MKIREIGKWLRQKLTKGSSEPIADAGMIRDGGAGGVCADTGGAAKAESVGAAVGTAGAARRTWEYVRGAGSVRWLPIAARVTFAFFLSRVSLLGGCFPLGIAYACAAADWVPVLFLASFCGSLAAGADALLPATVTICAFLLRTMVGRWLMTEREETEGDLWDDSAERTGAERAAPGTAGRGTSKIGEILLPRGMYSEGVWYRTGAAAIAGVIGGIMLLVMRDFSAQAVLGAAGYAGLSGLFCRGFCGYGDVRSQRERDVGRAAVLCGAVLTLKGLTVLSLSLPTVAAAVLTFWTTRRHGMLRGCVMGVLMGLCCDVVYAPAFGAAGFLFGAFPSGGLAAGLSSALVVGGGYAVAVGGFAALRGVVPDLIVGAAVTYPFLKLFPPRPAAANGKEGRVPEKLRQTPPGERALEERLDTVSRTLEGLSSSFYALSAGTRRPSNAEVRRIVRRTYERHCASCEYERVCWGDDFEKTNAAREKLITALTEGSAPQPSFAPPYIRERCASLEALFREINGEVTALWERKRREDKTEVFAANYESMSKLLLASCAEHAASQSFDPAASAKLRRALASMNVLCGSLSVSDKRRCRIEAEGVDLVRGGAGADEIRRACENVLGRYYDLPTYEIDGRRVTMRLEPRPCLRVCFAKDQIPAVRGEPCGDAVVTFGTDDDRSCAILCDGMGTGAEAAAAAGISALFLERLLPAVSAPEVSLEMLNAFLRGRGCECSASVDLLIVDTLLGTAHFIKSGAAPSFVLRDGKVFRIASDTAPVGILRTAHAQKTSFALQSGDLILLMSDGAAANETEEAAVVEWLEQGVGEDLGAAASELSAKLCAASRRTRADDLSVVLAAIGETK